MHSTSLTSSMSATQASERRIAGKVPVSARKVAEPSLIKLPSELCLKVFEYAARNHSGTIKTVNSDERRYPKLTIFPSLAGICVELHIEVLEAFYSTRDLLLQAEEAKTRSSQPPRSDHPRSGRSMAGYLVQSGERWDIQNMQCGSGPRGWRFGTEELVQSRYCMRLPPAGVRGFGRLAEMVIEVPWMPHDRTKRRYSRRDTVIRGYYDPKNDWLMPVRALWHGMGFRQVKQLTVWLNYTGLFGAEEAKLMDGVRDELLSVPQVKELLVARGIRVFCGDKTHKLWADQSNKR